MAETFERIKSSVNLGIKGIGNKTSSMLGKATLKMDIETILRSIEKDYATLGEAMYKTWAARESLAALQDQLLAIQKKFAQIAELEKQIAAIEEQANQTVAESMGVPQTPAVRSQPVARFCKSCGAEVVEGAAFCRACGQKLS